MLCDYWMKDILGIAILYLKMGKMLLKSNLITKPNYFADKNDFCIQLFCYSVSKLNE